MPIQRHQILTYPVRGQVRFNFQVPEGSSLIPGSLKIVLRGDPDRLWRAIRTITCGDCLARPPYQARLVDQGPLSELTVPLNFFCDQVSEPVTRRGLGAALLLVYLSNESGLLEARLDFQTITTETFTRDPRGILDPYSV